MKIYRRLLALMMVLAMVLTYMPAMVFAEDGDTAVDDPIGVVLPVSAEPLMVDHIRGVVGTDIIKHSGYSGFMVTYSDGTVIDYVYKEGTATGPDGEEYNYAACYKDGVVSQQEGDYLYAYAYEDDEYQLVLKEGWNKDVRLMLNVPYWIVSEGSGEKQYDTQNMEILVDVWCDSRKPTSIEFVPAEGFMAEGLIGNNYIDESTFYGEGNAFDAGYEYLSYDPETEQYGHVEFITTYRYVKEEDGTEGFYENGNPDFERLEFPLDIQEVWLNKGINDVELTYSAYADGSDEPIDLTFTVPIAANKYYAYANWQVFDYTGKYVTKTAFAKKLVVRDSTDKKIPASAYTYSFKKQKKMGWYSVEIKFKDTSKYVDSIDADYGIGPKTPKVTKVTGGKKKLTVKWKKFTKSQLKYIDGMYIELAQNKRFTKGLKIVKVSKKNLKKGYATIKKLAGKKKYYVRLSTYKKIKQSGESFPMFSNDSNIKAAKTK